MWFSRKVDPFPNLVEEFHKKSEIRTPEWRSHLAFLKLMAEICQASPCLGVSGTGGTKEAGKAFQMTNKSHTDHDTDKKNSVFTCGSAFRCYGDVLLNSEPF